MFFYSREPIHKFKDDSFISQLNLVACFKKYAELTQSQY
jgi:hypothetical protein